MKAIFHILALWLLLIAPLKAESQRFVEGRHYARVTHVGPQVAATSEPVLVEYFSFSCPGCYAIEPNLLAVAKAEPTLKVRTVHVPYGGSKAKFSQKAFVLMTLLDAKEHKGAIFNRVHEQRNTFDSDGELIDFFQALGYQRSTIEATLNSFSADTMVRKMNQEAISNQIRSVPTIIINNTFKVNVGLVNTADSMAALIRHLNGLP